MIFESEGRAFIMAGEVERMVREYVARAGVVLPTPILIETMQDPRAGTALRITWLPTPVSSEPIAPRSNGTNESGGIVP